MNAISCPHCAKPIANDPRFAGQVVACPHCAKRIKLPCGVPGQDPDPLDFLNDPGAPSIPGASTFPSQLIPSQSMAITSGLGSQLRQRPALLVIAVSVVTLAFVMLAAICLKTGSGDATAPSTDVFVPSPSITDGHDLPMGVTETNVLNAMGKDGSRIDVIQTLTLDDATASQGSGRSPPWRSWTGNGLALVLDGPPSSVTRITLVNPDTDVEGQNLAAVVVLAGLCHGVYDHGAFDESTNNFFKTTLTNGVRQALLRPHEGGIGFRKNRGGFALVVLMSVQRGRPTAMYSLINKLSPDTPSNGHVESPSLVPISQPEVAGNEPTSVTPTNSLIKTNDDSMPPVTAPDQIRQPQVVPNPMREGPQPNTDAEKNTRRAKQATIPDTVAQHQALIELKKMLKREYQFADSPGGREVLARKLAELAAKTDTEPVMRYVMATQALENAIKVCDVGLASALVHGLCQYDSVDAWELKTKTLAQLSTNARNVAARQAVATGALALVDGALADGRYEIAVQLASNAIDLAATLRNPEFLEKARDARARAHQKQHAAETQRSTAK